MKKTYKFTNLCCANCAAKIERQAAALPGVESCTLNFMFLKMAVVVLTGQLKFLVVLSRQEY